MTTIIVTHEDNEVDEFEFDSSQSVVSIGRRSSNDICIPDLSISGNHAHITIDNGVAWLEDLNSTNGSYVNGQSVQNQALNPSDEIILGKVQIIIRDLPLAAIDSTVDNTVDSEELTVPPLSVAPAMEPIVHAEESDAAVSANEAIQTQHPLDGVEHLVVPPGKPSVTPMHELDSIPGTSKGAVIEIKNGAKSGQILPIDKPVTTLGRPGIQIAAIMRKPDGYFLMHIESDDSVDRPTLNQDSIGDEPVMLHSGDELNVAGINVEFMLS